MVDDILVGEAKVRRLFFGGMPIKALSFHLLNDGRYYNEFEKLRELYAQGITRYVEAEREHRIVARKIVNDLAEKEFTHIGYYGEPYETDVPDLVPVNLENIFSYIAEWQL